MSDNNKFREHAYAIAQLLDEQGGEETCALDLSPNCGFTDYFVITTADSAGRLRGLARRLRDYLSEYDLEPSQRHKRLEDSGWTLFDCGPIVVHLMSREMRSFYDLERLWFEARVLFQSSSSSS
ncbi:MAG: ribosome silencing factor [Spirochaetaceae bacterium]|nr:MAG: ribosome silencing factor [Spirochaetaceae bacterium]